MGVNGGPGTDLDGLEWKQRTSVGTKVGKGGPKMDVKGFRCV